MESDNVTHSVSNFKINCSGYPEDFDLDKSICKAHFRQFGKVTRLIFKQRQHVIVVEYTNEDDYLNALANASEYNDETFKVEPFEVSQTQRQTPPVLKKKVVKRHNVSYVDNDEVNKELEAMGGYAVTSNDLTGDVPKKAHKRTPKLNRVWRREESEKAMEKVQIMAVKKKILENIAKNKVKERTTKVLSTEQLDLLKVIKSQANTVEEKFRVLDARDKLLRLNRKNASQFKSSPTAGTCPDMCPEKERLLREIQHQVSLYEQEDGNRHLINPNKAVKQYSRSSADQEAPLPHELRPVSILQLTMQYLMHNIMNLCENGSDINLGEWFHFLWDRTRGIRKDITQQALCCQGSVELVEQCARFHIHCSARFMGEDPSVFDQKINTENLTKCLQTLKYMYHDLELKGEHTPNEAEFRAYIILLNLNDGNFMWEVQELRLEIQKSPAIKFALQIYSAFDKRNYVKFFKLIKSTTYLNACILMRYFNQFRVTAIESLIRCFTPPKSISFYPIKELTDILFFDNDDTTTDLMRTYGLSVNKNGTHFLVDRSSFGMPDYPYVLERSSRVENKRDGGVGMVVCGREMSPEMYMLMSSHETHNSFDKDGYLVHDEMFTEIEMRVEDTLLDEGDSRETTPEPKSVVTNIFAQKPQRPTSPNVFAPKRDDNVFSQNKEESVNIFKPNDNIFASIPPSEKRTTDVNIFAKKTPASTEGSSIFSRLANENLGGLFPKPSNANENTWGLSQGTQNIFRLPQDTGIPEVKPNIFSQKSSQGIAAEPKRGGFTFPLVRTTKSSEVPNIFAHEFQPSMELEEENKMESEDVKRSQDQEELMVLEKERERLTEELKRETEREEEEKRHMDEVRRKNEEAAERRRIEAEKMRLEDMERKKLEEQERREREEKLRIEKKRQEDELKRKQEELERERKKHKEFLKNKEIKRTVKSVVTKMVEAVDLKIRQDTLEKIRQSIKKRSLIKICKKWRSTVVKNMKKRKAMDCSPMWVSTQNVEQCAKDLHAKSQDLTLSNMKRYKYGRPLDIPLVEDQPVGRINLFYLTYSSLRRRLCEVQEKWRQHIYWKVVVSIPGEQEMENGLHKLEDTLRRYIDWKKDASGNTVYVEGYKTVTYCIERQQGFKAGSSDANALVFIAKSFNSLMQRRVFENLKDFGVHVKLPIVIILENSLESEDYLNSLRNTGVISDYVIYCCNITSQVLPSIIDNGLIFLSKRVEKYPPLELDTLASFLKKHLCTEIWRKASSFAKWNSEYNVCMRDPNVVISLYNEGLKLLREIVLDKNCKEYAVFPEVLKEYLPDGVPDFLPCDYRYFSTFLTTQAYQNKLKSKLKNLTLPKFHEKWPPENETDLLLSISKYCTRVFKNPKEPFIAVLNILRDSVKEDKYDHILWTEAIEIIAIEKLKEQDLTLPKKGYESPVFKTFVVVYNTETLNEYTTSDWFYRNNRMIEKYKKNMSKYVKEKEIDDIGEPRSKKRILDVSLNSEDILDVINKAESMLRSPKSLCLESKSQIDYLNKSLQDLEESIRVVKRMDEINYFKDFLKDN